MAGATSVLLVAQDFVLRLTVASLLAIAGTKVFPSWLAVLAAVSLTVAAVGVLIVPSIVVRLAAPPSSLISRAVPVLVALTLVT